MAVANADYWCGNTRRRKKKKKWNDGQAGVFLEVVRAERRGGSAQRLRESQWIDQEDGESCKTLGTGLTMSDGSKKQRPRNSAYEF